MAVTLTSVVVLLCLVGLNAYRFPDEQILKRLYDLEMRGYPLYEDDPRYQLMPQQEEPHPMVLDELLPQFPEADEYEDEDEGDEDDYIQSNPIKPEIRDDPDMIMKSDPEIRSNDPRDPETAQQSALWGTHYVSGGAGEGKQMLKPNGEEANKQEVKSDNALPAYCEPPNPCPKGYTESDNCVQGVDDTPTFNRKYILAQQDSGYCACDSEHMKQCPNDKPKIDTKPDKTESDIMSALDKQSSEESVEDERERRIFNRVAKKAPYMLKRSKRAALRKRNPFLSGPKLETAAKKSPPNMEWDRWSHLNNMDLDDQDFD